jgi:hypothetical protein
VKVLAAVCVAVSLAATEQVVAGAKPQHYAVLLDVSQSNPLVDYATHSRRLADDVSRRISTLAMGSRVTIATFGEYDVRKNVIQEKDVNIYFRPDTARQSVAQLIASTPEAIKSGKITAQGQTNIMAALQMIARRTDCTKYDTTVILVSDGKENSMFGHLPEPTIGQSFAGCEGFVIVGLLGDDPTHTGTLGKAWMSWCQAAGFKSCDYVE